MGALTIRQVRKSFGSVEILKGIDLAIDAGEFLILVGPSGCGKSTLLNMIAGLDVPTSGTIEIADRDVTNLPSKDRDIAMVFQSYALYPNMKVAREHRFRPRDAQGAQGAATTSAVQRVAKMLQIGHLLDRKPGAALGRPAPARRDGPRDGARPQAVPVRRTAVQPRRQAARRDARRDQAAAPANCRRPRSTSPTTRSRR